MGVNISKKVQGELQEQLKDAMEEGAAAAEEAAAEGEGAKNDCDSIKKKNMEDV